MAAHSINFHRLGSFEFIISIGLFTLLLDQLVEVLIPTPIVDDFEVGRIIKRLFPLWLLLATYNIWGRWPERVLVGVISVVFVTISPKYQ